jgi:protein involved in ribonucleotide reduction
MEWPFHKVLRALHYKMQIPIIARFHVKGNAKSVQKAPTWLHFNTSTGTSSDPTVTVVGIEMLCRKPEGS